PAPAAQGAVIQPAPAAPRKLPPRRPPLPQDRALAPSPADAPSQTDLGNRQLSAGDCLGAAETFRQSLQRAPDPAAFAGMVRALRAAGTPELARQYLKDGLSAFPTAPVLLRQGVALALDSDDEIPLADLAGRLVALAPHDPWTLTALGIGRLRQNRPTEALSSFAESLELAPTAVENLYYQGLCHDRLGDYNRALACYRRFLAEAGDRHPTHRRWLQGRIALLERADRH
ncbi:MAG TPA: tetratricopeptide repeat protein, partial [Candidatus Aminicenantes bacterium]|nr:tetratricopeptide repeat protein [Candidatus Aminicenantes bacterium]